MKRTLFPIVLTALVAGGLGFFIRSAVAAIPTTDPVMTFTGRLTNNGAPMAGAQEIVLEVWHPGGTTFDCKTPVQGVEVVNGFFKVPLTPSCVDALAAHANAEVDIKVNGASVGRTRAGAVPYAMEAKRADTATSAATGGPLATQVGDLETAVTALQNQRAAVKYRLGAGGTLAAGGNRLNFETRVFDLATPAVTTGASWAFKAPKAGVYAVTVALSLGGSAGAVDQYVALTLVTPSGDVILAHQFEPAGLVLNGASLVYLEKDDEAYVLESHSATRSYTIDTDLRFNSISFHLVN
ncbi:MAG: hypothetical protein HY904_12585 [Deltaproteobacteria bacterium]|nr:hypothetical protein [Deltaproteobacteria bacterium]